MSDLVHDLWWFIENVGYDTPDRTERFFALRERVREYKPGAELAALRKNPSGGRPIYQRCFCGLFTLPQLSRKPDDIQERHTPTFCVTPKRGRPKSLKTGTE